MPDPNTWGTDDSSGTSTASEQDAANKRALTLGLISAGLGMLSARRQWGESQGQALRGAIGEGGQAGLQTYLGSKTSDTQTMLAQRKAALESAQAQQNLQKGGLDIQQARKLMDQEAPIGQGMVDRYKNSALGAYLTPEMPHRDFYKLTTDYMKARMQAQAARGKERPEMIPVTNPDGTPGFADKHGDLTGYTPYNKPKEPKDETETNEKLASALEDRLAARADALITKVNANPKLDQPARQKLIDQYNNDASTEAASFKARFGIDVKPHRLSVDPASKSILPFVSDTPGDIGPDTGGALTADSAPAGSVAAHSDGRRWQKQADGTWKPL